MLISVNPSAYAVNLFGSRWTFHYVIWWVPWFIRLFLIYLLSCVVVFVMGWSENPYLNLRVSQENLDNLWNLFTTCNIKVYFNRLTTLMILKLINTYWMKLINISYFCSQQFVTSAAEFYWKICKLSQNFTRKVSASYTFTRINKNIALFK